MPQSPIPNILSLLTFLPLVGAIVLLFLKRPQDLPEYHGGHAEHDAPHAPESLPADPARTTVNLVAAFFAGLTFLLSLVLFGAFRSDYVESLTRNMQFLETANWIQVGNITIQYQVGVDGVSVLLIVLTTFLSLLCVLYSFHTRQRLKEFMVFLLLLETGMIGVFCALDLVLFYVFWEAMLIPMYFLIGIFGHERRIYAAVKFFLYTFAGSVLMLVAIVWIYQVAGTFDVLSLSNPQTPEGKKLAEYGLRHPQAMLWLFAAFSLAFMIKVPMFPFHTWLPDAHVEAPTAGSVILAGVLLKMGTYGFVRFCLPMFPKQAEETAWIFITLAIIGIVYGSIVAAVQPDAKKLVAYSSVAHLGFVVLGIFSFTQVGLMGALIQNINHGISTPMLFFIVGMLYERRHTRMISEFGGLKLVVPMMSTMLLIAVLSSIAVPFFNGFVGEFPILVGSWISRKTYDVGGYGTTALAATGMILSAVYMLWWFQRLMLGPVSRPENRHLPDLSRTEWTVLAPLAGLVFWIGLGSHFWTQRMDVAVEMILPQHLEAVNPDLPIQQVLDRQRIETLKRRGVVPIDPGTESSRRVSPLQTPGSSAPALPSGPMEGSMPSSPPFSGAPPAGSGQATPPAAGTPGNAAPGSEAPAEPLSGSPPGSPGEAPGGGATSSGPDAPAVSPSSGNAAEENR